MDDGRGRTTFSACDGGRLGSLDAGGFLVEVPRLRKYDKEDLGRFFSGDRVGAAD